MTNMGRPHHPDRGRVQAVIFALIGAAFVGTACAEQPVKTAAPPAAGIVAVQAAAPGDSIQEAAADFTPLGRAAFYGDVEAAERRLGEGADVNATSGSGTTPLILALQTPILPPATSGEDAKATEAFRTQQLRKLRIAGMLLARGADPARVTNQDMTALHFLVLMHAEESALVELLQIFLAKGADFDAPTNNGLTPLMLAADRNRLQLVKALLAAGADPKAVAKDGHTALSIARERGHGNVAELLEQKLP